MITVFFIFSSWFSAYFITEILFSVADPTFSHRTFYLSRIRFFPVFSLKYLLTWEKNQRYYVFGLKKTSFFKANLVVRRITMKRIVLAMLVLTIVVGSLFAGGGGGQAAPKYPQRPIEIIVPYSVGGGQDIWARITVKYADKYMPAGTRFVVSNITAGGGIAGATVMASSKPDGYQVGAIVPFQLTDQFINKGTPYTEAHFYPLAFGSSDGNFLIANPNLGFKDAADYIAYEKANPGKLTFGVGGAYNSHDFFRWKIELAAGIKTNRLPFNGGAPTLAAVIGGHCDVASVSISEALAAMEAGQVVAIGISDAERSPLAPNVKTMVEQGINVVHSQWRCMTVPPETPQDIKDMLIEAFRKTFENPEWVQECLQAGLNPINITGKDAVKFYQEDFQVYKNLVQELKIQAQ